MAIEIKKITTKEEWEKGLDLFDYSTIFLSWEWSLFETKQGKEFETFGIYENSKIVGLLPVKTIHAKRGSYLHVRHGPLIKWENLDIVTTTITFLKELAKQKKVQFVRISPLITPTEENNTLLKNYGFKRSVIHATDAELTLIIDLTKDIDTIFQDMKKLQGQ